MARGDSRFQVEPLVHVQAEGAVRACSRSVLSPKKMPSLPWTFLDSVHER
ncbi:hypothetical protein ACFYSF_34920 [Streptomyces canus]